MQYKIQCVGRQAHCLASVVTYTDTIVATFNHTKDINCREDDVNKSPPFHALATLDVINCP